MTQEDQILERVKQIGDLIEGAPYCECVKTDNPDNVFIRIVLDVKFTTKGAANIFSDHFGDYGIADDIADKAIEYMEDVWCHADVQWSDYVVRVGHELGCGPDDKLRREK